MSYFYARAKELAGPGVIVDERTFRHAGPKPQSREAALIMLADGVEASVRSLSSRDEPAIRAMVTRIIEERVSRRPVRRVRPHPARPRAHPRGVRRPAPRHVPHPDRLSAEHGRRARIARGRAAGGGERLGVVTRAIYLGPWRIDLTSGTASRSPIAGAALARAIAAALTAAGAPSPASIGLILTDDAELAGLNAAHLGKTGPTDVLSFPLLPPEAFPPHPGAERTPRPRAGDFPLPPGRRPHLGDIVVSVERAVEQADGGPWRPDRRRPLVAGRRAPPPGDPRRAPHLRLGPRRAGRGGRDARPRAAPARLDRATELPRRDARPPRPCRLRRPCYHLSTGPPGAGSGPVVLSAEGRLKVVVGLGNPGSQYAGTRHNIGWLVMDSSPNVPAGPGRAGSAMPPTWSMGRFRGLDLTLVKPLTYMNDSGLAVRKVLAREHAPLVDLLVVADDFALPFGKLRFREGGGPGGHNGLRSIIDELGTEKFSRLRVGIGEPDRSAVDHVLTRLRARRAATPRRAAGRGRRRGRGVGARGHQQGGQPLQHVRAAAGRHDPPGRRRARWTARPTPTGSAGRGPAGGGSARPSRTPDRCRTRRCAAAAAAIAGSPSASRPISPPATPPRPPTSLDFDVAEVDAEVADARRSDDRRRATDRDGRGAPGRRSAPAARDRRGGPQGRRPPLPDLSALPPLLAATGTFAALRERLGGRRRPAPDRPARRAGGRAARRQELPRGGPRARGRRRAPGLDRARRRDRRPRGRGARGLAGRPGGGDGPRAADGARLRAQRARSPTRRPPASRPSPLAHRPSSGDGGRASRRSSSTRSPRPTCRSPRASCAPAPGSTRTRSCASCSTSATCRSPRSPAAASSRGAAASSTSSRRRCRCRSGSSSSATRSIRSAPSTRPTSARSAAIERALLLPASEFLLPAGGATAIRDRLGRAAARLPERLAADLARFDTEALAQTRSGATAAGPAARPPAGRWSSAMRPRSGPRTWRRRPASTTSAGHAPGPRRAGRHRRGRGVPVAPGRRAPRRARRGGRAAEGLAAHVPAAPRLEEPAGRLADPRADVGIRAGRGRRDGPRRPVVGRSVRLAGARPAARSCRAPARCRRRPGARTTPGSCSPRTRRLAWPTSWAKPATRSRSWTGSRSPTARRGRPRRAQPQRRVRRRPGRPGVRHRPRAVRDRPDPTPAGAPAGRAARHPRAADARRPGRPHRSRRRPLRADAPARRGGRGSRLPRAVVRGRRPDLRAGRADRPGHPLLGR